MSILFKYMENTYTLLEDGYIRATQLSALNDPYEANYCKDSLEELSNDFGIYAENTGLEAGEVIDHVERKKNRVGVISFSESKDNLLMWAHYANDHKGVAVGFHFDMEEPDGIFENLFIPSGLTSTTWDGHELFVGVPIPIMYRKWPRYKVDKFDFDYSNIYAEGADRILFEIFQQKSDEWIYEKEHRITLKLEQADKVKLYDFEKIDNDNIKQIISERKCCEILNENGIKIHIIHLYKIKESSVREVVASYIANLSTNPQNIYLFKLAANAISHCIFGLNNKLTFTNNTASYAKSIGYFELWNTTLSSSHYALDFIPKQEGQ